MLPARSRYVSGYADGSSDAPLDLDSLELTEKKFFLLCFYVAALANKHSK